MTTSLKTRLRRERKRELRLQEIAFLRFFLFQFSLFPGEKKIPDWNICEIVVVLLSFNNPFSFTICVILFCILFCFFKVLYCYVFWTSRLLAHLKYTHTNFIVMLWNKWWIHSLCFLRCELLTESLSRRITDWLTYWNYRYFRALLISGIPTH